MVTKKLTTNLSSLKLPQNTNGHMLDTESGGLDNRAICSLLCNMMQCGLLDQPVSPQLQANDMLQKCVPKKGGE